MTESDLWRALPFVVGLIPLLWNMPSAIKVWIETKHIRRASRRADSAFALELSEKNNDSSLARYANELAYAALVGDNQFNHAQRAALLALTDAERVIACYDRVRGLLKVSPAAPIFRWRRKRHEHQTYRNFIVGACLIGYIVFGFAAVFFPYFFVDADSH